MATEGSVRRQERSEPVVARILQVTTEIIDRGGEQALTIAEVRDRTGVTIGSIYHHFGSREGLVAAGYASIYASMANYEIEQVRKLTRNVKDAADFRAAVVEASTTMYGKDGNEKRIRRMAVLSAAQHRPLLREAIAKQQDMVTEAWMEWITQIQAKGIYAKDLDIRSLAIFFQGFPFGRVFDNFSSSPVSDADWARIGELVFGALQAK